jgi:hypothetical protein
MYSLRSLVYLKKARLAGSMLKDFGVLASDTNYHPYYKNSDEMYVEFFKTSDAHGFVYCCDIPGLLIKQTFVGHLTFKFLLTLKLAVICCLTIKTDT